MNHETILNIMDKMAETGMTKFSYKKGEVEIKIEHSPSTVPVLQETSAPVAFSAPLQEQKSEKTELSGKEILSPFIGTFYSSSAPDLPPYVKVGDTVTKGQVLGIVEAMKLMNEIESEYDGEIIKILADNEQTVEYGQPLFLIREKA